MNIYSTLIFCFFVASAEEESRSNPCVLKTACLRYAIFRYITCFFVDKPLMTWIHSRLDPLVHIQPGQVPSHLGLSHMVRYRQDVGLAVQIERAFGLPGKRNIEINSLVHTAKQTNKSLDAKDLSSDRELTHTEKYLTFNALYCSFL